MSCLFERGREIQGADGAMSIWGDASPHSMSSFAAGWEAFRGMVFDTK